MSDSSPPLNLDNPADVLNAAADHLDRVGLHKGQFWESDNIRNAPCCVLGAMRTVLGAFAGGGTSYSVYYTGHSDEEPWWNTTPAYKALKAEAYKALKAEAGQFPAIINDKPETTKEDMVSLLRRAAVRAANLEPK